MMGSDFTLPSLGQGLKFTLSRGSQQRVFGMILRAVRKLACDPPAAILDCSRYRRIG
jgi:hypothetical protein